uniref:Uncharacterized protein n=1 Tax=Lepeophtheirus salmonis TaxID=72036 RepID=A0A0K2VAX3_LEPSM
MVYFTFQMTFFEKYPTFMVFYNKLNPYFKPFSIFYTILSIVGYSNRGSRAWGKCTPLKLILLMRRRNCKLYTTYIFLTLSFIILCYRITTYNN